MKQKLIRLIDIVYLKLFKTKITPEVYEFIANVSWIFLGTMIAKILLLIMQVWGGRILGPSLYGQFNLIYTIASVLIIPISLGISYSVIKYLASEKDQNTKQKIISTYILFSLSSILIWSIIYFLFKKKISATIGVDENIFYLAIIFSVFMFLQSGSESILQGLNKMSQLSISMINAYLIMFVLFVIFLIGEKPSLYLFFIPYILQYIIAIIISLTYFWAYIKLQFDKVIFQKMLHFGFYSFIINLTTVSQGMIDQLMLNHYLGQEGVGIYVAYFTSTIALIGILNNIFIKVFFPTAAKFDDKKKIFQRINKLLLPIGTIVLVSLPLISYIIINFYHYTINFKLIFLFTTVSIMDFALISYISLLNSINVKSIRSTSKILGLSFIINITLNFFLIPKFAIAGAIVATNITLIITIIYLHIKLKKIIDKEEKN